MCLLFLLKNQRHFWANPIRDGHLGSEDASWGRAPPHADSLVCEAPMRGSLEVPVRHQGWGLLNASTLNITLGRRQKERRSFLYAYLVATVTGSSGFVCAQIMYNAISLNFLIESWCYTIN